MTIVWENQDHSMFSVLVWTVCSSIATDFVHLTFTLIKYWVKHIVQVHNSFCIPFQLMNNLQLHECLDRRHNCGFKGVTLGVALLYSDCRINVDHYIYICLPLGSLQLP